MWSFFGALFGGLYLGSKLSVDRLNSRKADIRIAEMHRRQDNWGKAARAEELSVELISMAKTDEGFQKLKEGAESVIRRLPGMEYADIYGRMSQGASHTVRFIEAVKQGKVPCGDEWGLPERALWKCTDLDFSKSAKIAFLRWVEDTLQENGCDAHIYFDTMTLPKFVWEPNLISYEKAVSIRDANIENLIPGEPTEVTEARNSHKIKAKMQKVCYQKWLDAVNGGEMQSFLRLEFNEDHWHNIRQETLEFLRTLPGVEYADYWMTNDNFHDNCRNLILLIEMVKRGKLPSFCYDGIPSGLLDNTLDLYLSRATQIAFVNWVEETLRENGVNAELYYRTNAYPNFVFRPVLMDLSNATKINDPTLPSIMVGESEELIAARNKPIIQEKLDKKEQG